MERDESAPQPDASTEIRFNDGAAYERFMGVWSQRVGDVFLDWLRPAKGLRWLDVGCGNGAFTEQIVTQCAPAAVHGIDPSEAQLAFARQRPATAMAHYRTGDAMALPYAASAFDIAVMPLVLFFVPDPFVGVQEMARVVQPGGTVCAYVWDMEGGGFPYAALHAEMRTLGLPVPMPPHPEASRLDVLRELWTRAGLEAIDAREITVQRTFESFDDYWTTIKGGPSMGPAMATAPLEALEQLAARMRRCLPIDSNGGMTYEARAHAIAGKVARASD